MSIQPPIRPSESVWGTCTVVQCYSEAILGKPDERPEAISGLICQYKWRRNFDEKQDRLVSPGQYHSGKHRSVFLLDNGPPDSKNALQLTSGMEAICKRCLSIALA